MKNVIVTAGVIVACLICVPRVESSERAALTSPAPGSTLTGSTVTFQWTAGADVSQYFLEVGAAPGADDYFGQNMGTSLSVTVSGLPTNGTRVHARLWSFISGGWQWYDYDFIAYSAVPGVPAQMTTPSPGSTLTASTVTFEWTAGANVVKYGLEAGTVAGGREYYSQDLGTSLSATVSGLPGDASTIYVRLWSFIGTAWQWYDYTYTATGVPSSVPPTLTSLSPTSGPVGTSVAIIGTNFGATAGTSTVTFNGTIGTPTSWSATSIGVPVPAGATTGNVVVTVGGIASNAVPFTVAPNSAPTLLNPGDQVSAEGSTIGLRLMTMDLEGDPLVYSVVGLPSFLSLNVQTGAISGSVPPASTGTYALNAQVTDGNLWDTETFTWTVSPVALDVSPATVAPGGTVTVNWQGISGPTPTDWLGLFPIDAPDTGYVTWWRTTGSAGGTLLPTLPTPLAPGAYQLRLFAQNGFVRLAISNTMTVTGPGPALSANSPTVSLGGTLPVSWQSISAPTATDWVGVYTIGASDAEYVTYWRTPGTASGSQLVTLPPSVFTGVYQLRLFAQDSYQQLALSNSFAVIPVLSVGSTTIAPGGELTVSWQGVAAPAATDWFGLFPIGAPDGGYVSYWRTTGTTSGSLLVSTPLSLTPGAYELRLFAQNGFQRLAVTNGFTVTSTSITATPTTVARGETVTITIANAPGNARDWVALFNTGAGNTQYLNYQYLNGEETVTFTMPMTPGTYNVRLFLNDTYQLLATSATITVP